MTPRASNPHPREPDEDTDPDGPSQAGFDRRHYAAPHDSGPENEQAALAESSRGAWRLVLLMAAILAGAGTVISVTYAVDTARATSISREEIQMRVAPVERRVDALEFERAEQRAWRKTISRQMAAVCRASKADCPIGEE